MGVKAPDFVKTSPGIQSFFIQPASSIREAIACIDRNEKGIALVVDEKWRLVGTISDGDVRRAWAEGRDLDTPVSKLLALKVKSIYPRPVTALVGTGPADLIRLMKEKVVRQIPLLDPEGRVVDLVTQEDLAPDEMPSLQAVVMAGGYGTRLRPLTQKMPKPMLPVGKEPILGFIIKQLRKAGIRNVSISTHYKAKKITEHFGDGSEFGVRLQYITEDRPLGTAGSLGMMKPSKEPVLVINGDVLTKVNFRSMLEFHREHKADMTVAVQKYDVQVSYGVVETEDYLVRRLTEKPKFLYLVNAGIYLLEPSVLCLIPKGQHFDMTDLIQKLLDLGRPVVSFPVREYWLDIGNHAEYHQAQGDVKRGRLV